MVVEDILLGLYLIIIGIPRIIVGTTLHGITILGIAQIITTGIIIIIIILTIIIIIEDLKILTPIMVIEVECHQTLTRRLLNLNL